MCDPFQTIYDWHCQIVSWVRFIGRSSSVMRDVLASVENRVSKTLDFVLHVQLSSDTVSSCFATNHVIKVLQILLNRVLAVFRLDAFVALLFHQISGCVVSVSITISDEFATVSFYLLEVIRTVRDLVWNYFEGFKVSQNVFDELDLLCKRVRVVEA